MGPEVTLGSNSYYTVDRGGEQFDISIPPDFIEKLNNEGKEKGFITILQPYNIDKVDKGSPAQQAGLQSGDKILEVNNQNTLYFQLLRDEIEKHKNEEVSIKIDRGGEIINSTVRVDDKGTIGFKANLLLETQRVKYTFPEAVSSGTKEAFQVTIF